VERGQESVDKEADMKRLFVLLIVTTFAFTALTAVAQGTGKAKKTAKKISCCIKGECKDITKAECTKAKGKVVSDCSKCKASKQSKPAVKSDQKAPTLGDE
jgi:hypothetical protein